MNFKEFMFMKENTNSVETRKLWIKQIFLIVGDAIRTDKAQKTEIPNTFGSINFRINADTMDTLLNNSAFKNNKDAVTTTTSGKKLNVQVIAFSEMGAKKYQNKINTITIKEENDRVSIAFYISGGNNSEIDSSIDMMWKNKTGFEQLQSFFDKNMIRQQDSNSENNATSSNQNGNNEQDSYTNKKDKVINTINNLMNQLDEKKLVKVEQFIKSILGKS